MDEVRAPTEAEAVAAHAAGVSAVFGAFLASLILFLKQGDQTVAILGAGFCVFLILIRRRDIALFSSHQHVWLRRAAALRQRADQLAVAVPPPTAPAPCRRWRCRLRNEPAA